MLRATRGIRLTGSSVTLDLERTYLEPTPEVLAIQSLQDEVRNSPAILTIALYAEAARDMGMDTDDPLVMRRVIDGAVRAHERGQAHEAARASFRAMEAARRSGDRHPMLVYYMLQGGLVKIGITTNLKKRYGNLMPEAVLAVEPGGDAVEAERHEQFAELRSHGEWFHHGPPIRSHVEALHRRFLAEVGKPMNRWITALGVPTRAVLAG